jgi:hypothetical protein
VKEKGHDDPPYPAAIALRAPECWSAHYSYHLFSKILIHTVLIIPLAPATPTPGLGVEGSTITKDFNANDVVSFLHGLPHYDLSLHKSDNVFDPKSWSYDQVTYRSYLEPVY